MNKLLISITAVVAISFLAGCGPSSKLSIGERKQLIIDMEQETLQKFYRQQPEARQKIQNAAGYGVFSNANVNLIFVSAGGGYGVVVDNATGKRTYMNMALGGVGLGVGAKDYRQIIVMKNKEVLNKFIYSGWEFGGHADAAAKAGESGAEASGAGAIGSQIEVYSITESGLALQATVAGTKYWKDDELN